jgi:hypothetical protein
MKFYEQELRDAAGRTVRCEANPWSDWCQRGKPLLNEHQGPNDNVCGACCREGYTAPSSGTKRGAA